MRRRAELRRRDDVRSAGELRLLDRVDQKETHFDPAVGLRSQATDNYGVGAARGPVAEAHVLRARRARIDAGRIDQLEQAAAPQVRGDDLGQRVRVVAFTG